MKINSGNSTPLPQLQPEKSIAKWEGPDLDAGKKINDSGASQALAKDAKGELNISGALRRSAIDQDLDQSDQKNAAIKQQILEYPSGNH